MSADAAPVAADSKPTTQEWRFTPREWCFFGLLIAAGLLFRWILLDMRPMHHDESLHGMYGRYFFDFPDQNFYRYDPMLHGPFLYNMLRFVYNTLGSSIWSARFPVALMGSILLVLPFLARRYFSKHAVLLLTAAIALSPTITYWSRFIREDMPSLCALVLMVYGAALAKPARKCFFVLFGFAWMFTIKENSFVETAIVCGFIIFDYLFDFARNGLYRGLARNRRFLGALIAVPVVLYALATTSALDVSADFIERCHTYLVQLCLHFSEFKDSGSPVSKVLCLLGGAALAAGLIVVTGRSLTALTRLCPTTALGRLWSYARTYRWECCVAAAIAALWYAYLFSAGFRYSEGILDGLYRKSLAYWLHHHSIERIKGPFNFHLYVLSWYELPFVLAFIGHLWTFYRRGPSWSRWVAGLAGLGIVFALIQSMGASVETNRVWQIFKLKNSLDIVGLIVLLIHPFVVTLVHLQRRQFALALWGYLFTANLFTYSYLGEKVPWLTIYPFAAGLVYLALYFDDYCRTRPLPARISWEGILLTCGSTLGALTLIFIIEEGYEPNIPFLVLTCLILALGYFEGWRKPLGEASLRVLVFTVFVVYSTRALVLTNFTYAGKASEFLSQVHTTHEFHDLVMKIREEYLAPPSGKRPTILGIEESVWPITWYLVDIPGYRFTANDRERAEFTYIFQNFAEPAANLPDGWNSLKVPLRGWWVPEYEQMTLKKFLAYSLNHTPWNPTGFTELSFLANPKR